MLPSLHCHSCSHHAIIAVVTTMLSLPHSPCHRPHTVASSPHCCIVAALLHRRRSVASSQSPYRCCHCSHRRHHCSCRSSMLLSSHCHCHSCHTLLVTVAVLQSPCIDAAVIASLLPQFPCHCCHSFHPIVITIPSWWLLIVALVDCCSG